MRAKAFCPGHVTGFFEICRSSDILSSGSRGAGMCLSLGATTELELVDSDEDRIQVLIDGRLRNAETTIRTLERIMNGRTEAVRVSTVLDLPESQGFGMSAAGAISAGLALCNALQLDEEAAFEAAHAAEIEFATGMGDVSAIRCGGVVVRESAGLPPRGKVRRIEGSPEVVLAVVGKPFSTALALENAELMGRVNREGARRVDELVREPSVRNLMRLSTSFAKDTGLASDEVQKAIDSASFAGDASMSMLGNSVFAIGQAEELASILSSHGSVFRCRVDTEGARLVGH